jgi:hypothetical protein
MQKDEARRRKIGLADLINKPWCLASLESFQNPFCRRFSGAVGPSTISGRDHHFEESNIRPAARLFIDCAREVARLFQMAIAWRHYAAGVASDSDRTADVATIRFGSNADVQ